MCLIRIKILCVLLAIVGATRAVQVFTGTNSQWDSQSNRDSRYNSLTSQQIPQYPSEYPPEYTPHYPPQYTPPYPTQSRPQNPPQHRPPFTIPNKPPQPIRPTVVAVTTPTPSSTLQPTKYPPPPPFQQPYPVHHNQVLNPSVRPTLPSSSSSSLIPVPVVEQYNHRFPDGSYEFRYELPDETVRYERGYYIYFQHKKSLVVRGYYSYRLPGAGYLTVFYTADQYGYRQDSSGITPQRPQLPKTLGERRILDDEESINVTSSINDNKLQ